MTTFTLPIPPSVNGLFFNRPGKGRAKTDAYRTWRNTAGWELIHQKPERIKGPVVLEYIAQRGGTKADLGNLEKPLTDLLVTHRIIEGDGPDVVEGITLRWSDRVIGVEVTVRPAGEHVATDPRLLSPVELETVRGGA